MKQRRHGAIDIWKILREVENATQIVTDIRDAMSRKEDTSNSNPKGRQPCQEQT